MRLPRGTDGRIDEQHAGLARAGEWRRRIVQAETHPIQYPDVDLTIESYAGRRILILAGLFIALYVVNLLLLRDLWVQDEARYGEVVREMLATGHWLVPYLNGHPYPDKPVLYFWIVGAVSAVVGQGALAFRLVSIAFTLAAATGVYLLASRLGPERSAFRAAAAFLTLVLTLIVGQIARMDMMLTASVAFAMHAYVRHHQGGSGRWMVAFWGFVLLGVATKGPIALLFTVMPAMVTAAWTGGWRGFASLRPLLGLLGLVALVAAWAVPVWVFGYGQYLAVIWNEQLVGRTVNAWTHQQPVYFYLLWAPILSMPWTMLVGGGVYALCRDRDAWHGTGHEQTLMVAFLLVPFVSISLISGKLFIYLEPLAPVTALVVAWQLARFEDAYGVPAWVRYPPALFLALFGMVLIGLAIHYIWPQGHTVIFAGAAIVLLGISALFVMPRRPGPWFTGWLYHSVLFSWLFLGIGVWALNPFFSPRAMGEAVRAAAPPGTPVGVVRTTRGTLNYYAGRKFTELEAGQVAAWRQAHPDGVLVIKDDDMQAAFNNGNPEDCRVNRKVRLNFDTFHLLGGCPH